MKAEESLLHRVIIPNGAEQIYFAKTVQVESVRKIHCYEVIVFPLQSEIDLKRTRFTLPSRAIDREGCLEENTNISAKSLTLPPNQRVGNIGLVKL